MLTNQQNFNEIGYEMDSTFITSAACHTGQNYMHIVGSYTNENFRII